jgi:hypothetical protein
MAAYPGLKTWAVICYRFAVSFHFSLLTFHVSHSHTVGILNWLVPAFSYQRCMTLLYRV